MNYYINSLLLAITLFSSQLFAAENLLPPEDKNQFGAPITLKELSQSPYYIKVCDAYKSYTIPNNTIQKRLTNKKGPDKDVITFPEQFVINLPNAQILSSDGLVITADNRPFFDYVHQERFVAYEDDWKMRVLSNYLKVKSAHNPEEFNGSIAIIAAPGACCFYHWMFEMLPRLKTLQSSGVHYDKIFVGSNQQKFKKATLEVLGIPEDKILYGEYSTSIKAKNVIIPSMPHVCAFTRPTWACDFLRAGFLDEKTATLTKAQPKRIYISRKYSTNRYSERFVVNEKELIAYLETKGFETVLLENLSNKEQAQLFNAAEIIIATHGAGLLNLVFCNSKRPVTVIEFSPPAYVLECFSMLTEQLNNDRGFQFNYSGVVTSNANLSQKDKEMKNIYVELDQLDTILMNAIKTTHLQVNNCHEIRKEA